MAHDELLFIVVHQSFELWFDLVLFELETVREALFTGRTFPARHYLKRVQAIERMLIEHLSIIESMSPQDFLQFRGYLSPGQNNLERAALADDSRQTHRPAIDQRYAPTAAIDAEVGLFRHHPEVAP